MTIKLTTAIYVMVTLGLLVWFLVDLSRSEYGGDYWPGKRAGEMGCLSTVIIIIWIVFTLIFGGFVWW